MRAAGDQSEGEGEGETEAHGERGLLPQPAHRPAAGERQEGRGRMKPPECRIAPGQLAQDLVPAADEGEDRDRAEERDIAPMAVRDGMGQRHQGHAHEHGMAHNSMHARRLREGLSRERRRAPTQQPRDERHDPNRVREHEGKFDGAEVRHGPEPQSDVAVGEVVVENSGTNKTRATSE